MKKMSKEAIRRNRMKSQRRKNGTSFFASTHSIYLKSRKLFDIEEEDLIERVKCAVTMKPPFRQVIQNRPDLYGPFWISTSLIVLIIASSSLISIFGGEENYDFEQLSVATFLVPVPWLRFMAYLSGALMWSPLWSNCLEVSFQWCSWSVSMAIRSLSFCQSLLCASSTPMWCR